MQPQNERIFYVYFDIFKMAKVMKKCYDTLKKT